MTQAVYPPLVAIETSGTELAVHLNNLRASLIAQHLGPDRPSYAGLGILWWKGTVTGTTLDLMVNDGTEDVLVGVLNKTSHIFSYVFPAGSITGSMIANNAISPSSHIADNSIPLTKLQGDPGANKVPLSGGAVISTGQYAFINGAYPMLSGDPGYLTLHNSITGRHYQIQQTSDVLNVYRSTGTSAHNVPPSGWEQLFQINNLGQIWGKNYGFLHNRFAHYTPVEGMGPARITGGTGPYLIVEGYEIYQTGNGQLRLRPYGYKSETNPNNPPPGGGGEGP